ncbi:MAG TPA: YolD-like family protein [Bacillus bacterium]|uniref:YolD-like family protein n=1 Tax=Siminovitchia fordii TaxID=254759 RepID=UPI00037B8CE4|nr:YolD-like family protein [Siminovitchia fordii]HBZ10544.1 YolD-like family protein [Bacillus sp. (in: firmicutes)]
MNKLTKGSNMRWESSRMTLPEHVEKILSWRDEQGEVQQPQLDEQQLEEINDILYIAIEYNKSVIITLWKERQFQKITGNLHFIDEINKQIHVVDKKEQIHKIKFDAIVEVEYSE